MLAGIRPPPHLSPKAAELKGTLKVGFLSNLQVAGWLFGNHRSWMSIYDVLYNVRLNSDVVKPKANIYNDLRTFYRIDCIAGDQDGRETPGQVTMSVIEMFRQLTSVLRLH